MFRSPQAGEQRLEGVLERIECGAGDGALFHVRASDGAVVFTAPSLAEVEFITHREHLTGDVACGAFPATLPVYVTWKPAENDDGRRVAVAIEFLPN